MTTHSQTRLRFGEALAWSEQVFFGLLFLSGLALGAYAVVHQAPIDLRLLQSVPVAHAVADELPSPVRS